MCAVLLTFVQSNCPISVTLHTHFQTKQMIIEDTQLGRFIVKTHPRARRLIFRTKSDAIHVSIPPGTSEREVRGAIEKLRYKLLLSREKHEMPLIDLNYRIDTEYFKLSLVSGNREKFLSHSELGEMRIICPPDADFRNEELQKWLRKVIVEGLRRNAQIILPPRLYRLAGKYGFSYGKLKINTSRSRWGSCSAQGNINLSSYLVLLPGHLIDYVLLHELCHTREMNHGPGFWKLMDEVTDHKAQWLRKELRQFSMPF